MGEEAARRAGAIGYCLVLQSPMSVAGAASLPPGSWRAGAHTDWCCVTLLFQRVGEFGLECAANPRHGATEWAAVDPVQGGNTSRM